MLTHLNRKQKIGERVFKIFKTQAGGMKNVSRRTITLLDHEDLKSLMHLTEEFPEVSTATPIARERPDFQLIIWCS